MAKNLKQHLNEKSNRNWVRAALSLRYFKQGFEQFIDKQIESHHTDLLRRLKVEKGNSCLHCDQCTSENLLPDHFSQKKCIQKNRRHCFCSQPTFRRPCPNKICSFLYDYIVKTHSTTDPFWTNTNPSNWFTDYWELGKCFLNSPGYGDKQCAADIDATGLLSIAINDIYIQDRMDTDIETLTKVKDIRNLILHSASFSLEDDEVIKYIDEMIRVLLDKKAFSSDTFAQDAIQHLNELKSVQCHISFEDELKVREESLKAIEQMTRNAVNTIRSTETNVLDAIKLQQDQIKNLIKRHEASHAKQKDINETATWKATDTKTHSSDRQDDTYIQDKQQMQAKLIGMYKQYFIKSDITPLIPEVKVDVESVYVPPELYTIGDFQNYYYNIKGDQRKRYKFSETDFLTNIVKQNILLTGNVGTGKTTLCYNMISAWCSAHESTSQLGDHTPHSLFPELKNKVNWRCHFCGIDFLFFISLKYCENQSYIEEMILKHLIDERYRDSLFKLLQYEPEKCLIILDDLNEWTPPAGTPESPTTSKGLPLRHLKSKYATIYTTRPWKLTTIRPKSGEFDRIIELEGIDPNPNATNIYLSRLFQNLNKLTHACRDTTDFLSCLEERGLTHFKRDPLLLKYVVSLWYDKSKLDASLTGNYSAIIDLLIGQAFKNNKLSNPSSETTENPCDVMELFEDKKYIKMHFDAVVLPLAVFSFRLCKLKRSFCYMYDTTNLSQYELNENKLKLFTDIGFLTERISYNRVIERCKAISFISVTFQDFFAAIYLSIHPNELSDICNTAESILRMTPVFQFLSGMNFCALQIISYIISSVIDNDEKCQDYRCGISSYKGFVIEMQLLLSSCVREASRSRIKIGPLALRDVYLGPETAEFMSAMCHIDFGEVRSLYFDTEVPVCTQEYIAKARNLDMLVCNNSEYLSSVTVEDIMRNNEGSLKCLKLLGKCFSDIKISSNMFQYLRCLVLSETKLSYDQFIHLVTNSCCLEEVELNLVTVSNNGDDTENVNVDDKVKVNGDDRVIVSGDDKVKASCCHSLKANDDDDRLKAIAKVNGIYSVTGNAADIVKGDCADSINACGDDNVKACGDDSVKASDHGDDDREKSSGDDNVKGNGDESVKANGDGSVKNNGSSIVKASDYDSVKADLLDTLPLISSVQRLKLKRCGIDFTCISLFPSLRKLSIERSSQRLLTEILLKSTSLTEVNVHVVTFESDEELMSSFSKLLHMKSLSLNTVTVSLKYLWELLYVVGKLPTAVLITLSDLKLEEGCSAKDLFLDIHVSKLFRLTAFDANGNCVTNAGMISVTKQNTDTESTKR